MGFVPKFKEPSLKFLLGLVLDKKEPEREEVEEFLVLVNLSSEKVDKDVLDPGWEEFRSDRDLENENLRSRASGELEGGSTVRRAGEDGLEEDPFGRGVKVDTREPSSVLASDIRITGCRISVSASSLFPMIRLADC